MTSPLLLTGSSILRDDVLRLAAAAGVTPEVLDVDDTLPLAWGTADLVLVGADAAERVALLRPPRRPGVHVVGPAPLPHEVFRAAVRFGAEDVAELPQSQSWLVEVLTDSLDGGAYPGRVVAVLGGSGGIGASVLAAALAATWGARGPTLLVDADPCGAGLERVLGMERLHGTCWSGLGSATGRISGRSLREALPHRHGVGLLGWGGLAREPVPPFAVREVLSAAGRGHDAVVVDLPRQGDAAAEEILARADDVLLVCGSTLTAVAAAGRAVARLEGLAARPHLVVREGGGLAPGELARAFGLPLVAVTRHQRGLEEALDLGAGPLHARRGSVARAARDVVARLERDTPAVAA
ncbi:septum site-determining protein Ssd [Nocardioides mangrovicus]|uniref:septum site-determining protein Ssd n=1 Tax=Nocardioides mangrovicus TaxID=2478913 RepID=UPI0018E0B0CD|nr:septum site-determining protein Ssd [Nocardioides mangrovicus]